VWHLETAAPLRTAVRPDACLDIIYSREEGLQAVGTMTVEQRYDRPGGAVMTGIRFQPGMAGEFLGVSPARLTGRTVPLEDRLGRDARQLAARLDDARSAGDRARIMGSFLRIPASPPDPVQCAIEALAEARGVADLDRIAAQSNLSPRQFRRRCLEQSGLTPKQLCRILRFRHAVSLAQAPRKRDWAQIAAEAGYFDQAHLIRDFREFTGRTPMSVFSNPALPAPA
jgi:AraC-like DNA-binding protein